MKNRLFFLCLIVFFCVTHSDVALAGWQAVIHAEGEDLGGQYKSDLTIGTDAEALTKSAAPLPPQYSCSMVIPSADWVSNFTTDIRQGCETEYNWIIAINPSGNIAPPSERTTTISWDPSDLDCNSFYQLKEGDEGTGEIVVPDMKSTSEYQVSGSNSDQYFTLTATVAEELTAKIVSPYSDAIIYEGEPVHFQGSVAGCNSPAFSWNFGDSGLENSDKKEPEVTFPVAGTYEITLTVTDADNSIHNTSITVTVMPVKIDIDGSETTDLKDAILALKILTGMDSADDDIHLADINNDKRIGMAEVIHILKKLTGE